MVIVLTPNQLNIKVLNQYARSMKSFISKPLSKRITMSTSSEEEKGYISATIITKPVESCSIVHTHYTFTWWLTPARNHLCAHMLAVANRLVRLAIKINTKNLCTSGKMKMSASTLSATFAQRNSSRRTTSDSIIKDFIKRLKNDETKNKMKWNTKANLSLAFSKNNFS